MKDNLIDKRLKLYLLHATIIIIYVCLYLWLLVAIEISNTSNKLDAIAFKSLSVFLDILCTWIPLLSFFSAIIARLLALRPIDFLVPFSIMSCVLLSAIGYVTLPSGDNYIGGGVFLGLIYTAIAMIGYFITYLLFRFIKARKLNN